MKLSWKLMITIHVALYRLTSGRIGGRMGNGTVLLLTTTGRKSGKHRTVPVLYFPDDDGNPVVTASKAGLPENPEWFENLRKNPRVSYQVNGEKKNAVAEIAGPQLRDHLWTKLTSKYKGYLEYQKKDHQGDSDGHASSGCVDQLVINLTQRSSLTRTRPSIFVIPVYPSARTEVFRLWR